MKKKLIFLLVFFFSVIFYRSNATTYYVATSGSDSNPGTLASPFRTWEKGASVLTAGDTLYIRGGSYPSPVLSGVQDWIVTFANLHGTSGSHIVIANYPNENPILDLNGFSQTRNTTALRINECDWVDIYGLRIQNVVQTGANIIAGIDVHACVNMKFERVSVFNIGGAGIRQSQMNGIDTRKNDNFTYVNCDASWCADPTSTGGGNYGNADGFDTNEGTTSYTGCRAWWNSDDGFDYSFNDSSVATINCLSFRNGYIPGTFTDPGPQADGMGFKWAIGSMTTPPTLTRTFTQCIAFDNKAAAYDQNAGPVKAQFYNCDAFRCPNGWQTGWGITPRIAHVLTNNIAYLTTTAVTDQTGLVMTTNSWQVAPPSLTSFSSTDTSGISGSRQSDGSLPNSSFLHLSVASNQLDIGTNVNLPYCGTAPDLGAYELCPISPPSTHTYYFDAVNGNDNNTVLQAQNSATPWKTVVKFNSQFTSFNAGDSILFRRGQVFYGAMVISKNGTSSSSINIGAWGTGAKPVITGLADVTGWTNVGGNIWQSAVVSPAFDTAMIVTVNGVSVPMGKFPDGFGTATCGWRRYASGSLSNITDNGVYGGCTNDAIPNLNGGTIVIRKNQFTIQKGTVSTNGSPWTYTPYPGQSSVVTFTLDNGYFIQNHINTLTVQNEWFWNRTTHTLSMFSSGSPANIKVSTVRNLVDLTNRSFISFSDIKFEGSIYDLVTMNGANGIKFTSCNINASGNCAVWGNSMSNCTFQSDSITNSNNFGIFTANTANTGNVVNSCYIYNTGINAGMTMQDSHTIIESADGILALGGISCQLNTIKKSGYAAIQFRGSNVLIKNNYVDSGCITKDEGSLIYSFIGNGNPTFTNQVIDGNIVLNAVGALAGKVSTTRDAKGIYMDINLRNVTITNNSVANCGTYGIIMQDNVNNVVRGNTVYNATNAAFGMWSDNGNGGVINSGHVIRRNIFVMRDNRTPPASNFGTFYFQNLVNLNETSWGTSDSNVVSCPINENNNFYSALTPSTFFHRTLAQWQAATGNDTHSQVAFKAITTLNDIQFVYNETNAPKTIGLSGTWADVSGTPSFPGSITLQPYTSRVLLFVNGTGPTPLTATSVVQQNPIPCFNGTTTVTIIASGGTPPYQYRIGSGTFSTTNAFPGLTAGTYTFQVRDAVNTLFSLNVTITQNPQITISESHTAILINGQNSTITITAGGGSGTKTYSLDGVNFQASNVFTRGAGTYTVTVKDALGCTNTLSFTITQPSAVSISASASPNPVACFGNVATITATGAGGTTPYQYSLNGGAFAAQNVFSGLGVGTYTITVRDAAGATATTQVTITGPTQITISESHTAILVNGNNSTITITANGGTGTKQYSIDGGANYQASNIFTKPAGTYTVIVRDANLCTNSLTFTITQPSAIALNLSAAQNPLLCFNATTTITATGSGATPPYQYSIDGVNYSTTNTFVRGAGTYSISVKDAAGAIITNTITITQPTQITITESHTAILVNGNNSTITITASNGTPGYTYSLDGVNFQAGNTFVRGAGTYTVTVKDANNCTNTLTFTITQPTALSSSAAVIASIPCNGSTATARVTSTGGTTPYQYRVGNGPLQSSTDFAGLLAGTYQFFTQDAGGALVSTQLTIGQPSIITLSATPSGPAPATITASASGGAGSFSYKLDNGSFQPSGIFTNVSAGNHTVTARDANLCTQTKTVNVGTPLTFQMVVGTILCNGDSTTVAVNAVGGVPPYTGTGTFFRRAGTWTFTVFDATSARADTTIAIPEPTAIGIVVNAGTILTNGGSAAVTITASNGTPAYQYQIDNGGYQVSNSFPTVFAGNHTAFVKDANGCVKSQAFTMSQPGVLGLSVSPGTAITCAGGTMTVTVTGNGGTTPYLFGRDGVFGSSGSFANTTAGTHTFSIRDAFNNQHDTIVTIPQPSALTLSVATGTISVSGGNTTVDGTAGGGTPGYTYSLDNAGFVGSSHFTGVLAGQHNLRVKDANGCITQNIFSISQPDALVITISRGAAINCPGGTQAITVGATGGTAPYTGTGVFNKLAGTYTFSVTDQFGAQADTIIDVTQPPALTLSVNFTPILVFGGTSVVTATGGGGTGTLQYSLDGGTYQLSGSFGGVVAGPHTITLKDAHNCTLVNSFSISQPGALIISISIAQNPLLCYGDQTLVTVGATGGTPPYTGTGSTLKSAGTYTIHVVDAFGAVRDSIITITQPPLISLIQVVQSAILTYGAVADSVIISNAGGTPINDTLYQYSLDGGSFIQSDSAFKKVYYNMAGGAHTITIRDAHSCTATYSFDVAQPPPPLPYIQRRRIRHVWKQL